MRSKLLGKSGRSAIAPKGLKLSVKVNVNKFQSFRIQPDLVRIHQIHQISDQIQIWIECTPSFIQHLCCAERMSACFNLPLPSFCQYHRRYTFRQACSYLPSRRASPRFDQYQLHCLVTEAHVREQLAQSRYMTVRHPQVKPATS